MTNVEKMALLIYLSICTRTDVRWRYVSLFVSIFFVFGEIVYILILQVNIGWHFRGMIPGAIVLGISMICKKIGAGDGVMLAAAGLFIGGMRVSEYIFSVFVLAVLYEGGERLCVGIGPERQKEEKPLAPFCLAAYFITLVGWQQ